MSNCRAGFATKPNSKGSTRCHREFSVIVSDIPWLGFEGGFSNIRAGLLVRNTWLQSRQHYGAPCDFADRGDGSTR